jgi:cyclopropane fatty-acyl-phospholipid synthase-like methyltransferase
MIQEFSAKFKDVPDAEGLSLNIETEELPGTQGEFDLVVSAMAFHHLQGPLVVLKKLKNHLSCDGKIFVVDLDQEDGSFHLEPQKMGVHHFGFSKEDRDLWCEKAGFKTVTHEAVFEISKNDRVYPVIMSVYSV